MRFVIVTLDHHLTAALERAGRRLAGDLPGLELRVHVAAEWGPHPDALTRCLDDIGAADLLLVTQLFLDEHVQAVGAALHARRGACTALICVMCAGDLMRLTRMGKFSMAAGSRAARSPWSPAAIIRRLLGGAGDRARGEHQLRQLRRIPRLLQFIPGTAQDVRAYYLTLQYWLNGSDENLAAMVRYLVGRYAPHALGPAGTAAAEPIQYPDVGLYHPALGDRITDDVTRLPRPARDRSAGAVGLLLMRSYILSGNTRHYDAVIEALEARGLAVIPAFSSGLDGRLALERYFRGPGGSVVDAVVSLTGFSLVGGPAYNDTAAAQAVLSSLDVPYLSALSLEFQTVEEWRTDPRGLTPLQATLMIALPELDGATGGTVYGGKSSAGGAGDRGEDARPVEERVERLADRVIRLVALRRAPAAERRVAIVLFNFPPNAGAVGTAAYLSVFESLHRTLLALERRGYRVDPPADVDALRERILGGNSARYGTPANVQATIRADDHVRREPWLGDLERVWGPAPGRQLSDGASLFVLGARFGNVFVGVQPAFGYEGDPMRLLFDGGFAPTHAFAAFYRWIREDFGAAAVVHFGTHGALEFMPGKQAGLTGDCWPERLLGDLPNFYLYASNNPSEGTLAKRRAAATLISYLTPPIAHAGLYRGLLELKATLDRYRGLEPGSLERPRLAELAQTQAAAIDLAPAEPAWSGEADREVTRLRDRLLEVEYALIPNGLHVIGEPLSPDARIDLLAAMEQANDGESGRVPRTRIEAMVRTGRVEPCPELAAGQQERLEELARIDRLLRQDHEIPALLHALDGGYMAAAPGGDLLRSPDVLPTGRNLCGIDPFRIPSAYAVIAGREQAERLLARHIADGRPLPETVGIVLWGTDNLKSEGEPIAQALALIGARPRFDAYGRLTGAVLVPLAELGRPRVDVALTVSGIFRDLLPLQMRLLAEACRLAAAADESPEQNFVRRHALEHMRSLDCDLETAALRVFSNVDGAYGSNVNHMLESGQWREPDDLADVFVRRKSFAFGVDRTCRPSPDLMRRILAGVELTCQNLESVELGVTDVDQYVEGLGGLQCAVTRERGAQVPAYISDRTMGPGRVRTLDEQVALEARTRMLNPKWYEAMLRHGYEGVRQIEAHTTAALGWSATAAAVAPWVYQGLAETFVLDHAMRERLAALNPTASARLAGRLLEATERRLWEPDEATLDALRSASEALEDRLEGISPEVAA